MEWHSDQHTDVQFYHPLRCQPQEYSERPPQPAAYIFAIDVSFHSVSTGVLADTCSAIKESLDRFPREADLATSPVKVGFLTYDRNVHFYNLNVRGVRTGALSETPTLTSMLPCQVSRV